MKPHPILIAFLLLQSFWLTAQPVTIQWQKTFGGSDNDECRFIQATTDGGYIAGGYAGSNDGDVVGFKGYIDYWLIKTDATGNVLWKKTYGGPLDEHFYQVKQTSDGGYIAAGFSRSQNGDITNNHGNYDFWVVKLNSAGSISWEQSYGGSMDDWAYSIQQTTDGGYVVVGSTSSNNGQVSGQQGNGDAWVIKLDALGALQWQHTYGGSESDWAYSVDQTLDGGYAVLCTAFSADGDITDNHGFHDFWLIKLDAMGQLQWDKNFGGSQSDEARFIEQTSDGGYFMAGYTNSNDQDVSGFHGDGDIWVVKTDAVGNIIWQRALGGTGQDNTLGACLTPGGGYALAAHSDSQDGDVTGNKGGFDYWIVELSSTGNITWQKNFGGTADDVAWSIDNTSDGNYIVGGGTFSDDRDVSGNHGGSDYWVIKLGNADSSSPCSGHKVAVCHNGHTLCVDENAVSAHIAHGDYLGICEGNNSFHSFALEEEYDAHLFEVLPNPNHGSFRIVFDREQLDAPYRQVEIITMKGERVQRIHVEREEYVEIPQLDPGLYLVKMTVGDEIEVKKVLVE